MNYKPSKKNKTHISWRHRSELKELYFKWQSSDTLADTFWYNRHFMREYFKSYATKNYMEDWVLKRRCSICKVWRPPTEYGKRGKYLQAECKICRALVRRNKNQILINTGKKQAQLDIRKLSWERHKWKQNLKRNVRSKVLKILYY